MAGTVHRLNAFVVTLMLLLASLTVTTNAAMAETPATGPHPCSMAISEPDHSMETNTAGESVCQDAAASSCVFGPAHCSLMMAVPADSRHSPVRTTTESVVTARRACYTNPIADVSTPPPNTRS